MHSLKRFARRAIELLAYWLGVDALFYWLNRNAKRIVTFHNILPDEMFRRGVANGVSNSESEFRNIIRELGRRYRFSTDLFDSDTLTLTFDDGYRNQYTTAFRILKEMDVPAYLFVSGGNCHGSSSQGLLVDKLLHWVAEAPIEFIPCGDRLKYWCEDVWPRYMKDSNRRGMSIFESFDSLYPYEKIIASLSEDYQRERLSGISPEELEEMRQAGWKIGWHTKNHYPLSRIQNDDLEGELVAPDKFRNECFSYPYGNLAEVGKDAVKMVEKLGYPCAVSDATKEGEPYCKWFLPRFALMPDKYQLHFDLSGLKHFLRHGRLLPSIKR